MKETLKDASLVVVPNGTVLGVVTFTQLEEAMKFSLLALSLAYTIWKFYHEIKKDRNEHL